jgi:hypothetical protein
MGDNNNNTSISPKIIQASLLTGGVGTVVGGLGGLIAAGNQPVPAESAFNISSEPVEVTARKQVEAEEGFLTWSKAEALDEYAKKIVEETARRVTENKEAYTQARARSDQQQGEVFIRGTKIGAMAGLGVLPGIWTLAALADGVTAVNGKRKKANDKRKKLLDERKKQRESELAERDIGR